MRREILRRIDAIPKVTYEPQMLREDVELKYSQDENAKKPCHYYRMKAIDEAKSLGRFKVQICMHVDILNYAHMTCMR